MIRFMVPIEPGGWEAVNGTVAQLPPMPAVARLWVNRADKAGLYVAVWHGWVEIKARDRADQLRLHFTKTTVTGLVVDLHGIDERKLTRRQISTWLGEQARASVRGHQATTVIVDDPGPDPLPLGER